MTNKIQKLLLPFYFGSIVDSDRLLIERELLTDSEVLVDFLDLKRNLENATEIPRLPSAQLWARLQDKIQPRKKLWISLSLGFATAASIAIISIYMIEPQSIETQTNGENQVLFDQLHELPANSNVL